MSAVFPTPAQPLTQRTEKDVFGSSIQRTMSSVIFSRVPGDGSRSAASCIAPGENAWLKAWIPMRHWMSTLSRTGVDKCRITIPNRDLPSTRSLLPEDSTLELSAFAEQGQGNWVSFTPEFPSCRCTLSPTTQIWWSLKLGKYQQVLAYDFWTASSLVRLPSQNATIFLEQIPVWTCSRCSPAVYT